MKEDIEELIKQYTIELSFLDIRVAKERQAEGGENESYFWGQWCRLDNCLCDLKAIQRKNLERLK